MKKDKRANSGFLRNISPDWNKTTIVTLINYTSPSVRKKILVPLNIARREAN